MSRWWHLALFAAFLVLAGIELIFFPVAGIVALEEKLLLLYRMSKLTSSVPRLDLQDAAAVCNGKEQCFICRASWSGLWLSMRNCDWSALGTSREKFKCLERLLSKTWVLSIFLCYQTEEEHNFSSNRLRFHAKTIFTSCFRWPFSPVNLELAYTSFTVPGAEW